MRISLSLLSVAVLLSIASPARADYFVWQDEKTGASFSYPDTWQMVNNADPNDIVTVMPPSGRATASCRLRARNDERYMIYPVEFSSAIQRIDYSRDFWNAYLTEYNNPYIMDFQDNAGLGRGFASYATVGFESAVKGPMMSRRAVLSAALYNGTAYILECSCHADAFAEWKQPFMSIAKSVDFRKAHHELEVGNYRNFLADPRIEFEGRGHSYTSY
jgi:hypothetical protein